MARDAAAIPITARTYIVNTHFVEKSKNEWRPCCDIIPHMIQALCIADEPLKKKIPIWLAEEKIDIIVSLGDFDEYQIADLQNVSLIPKIGVYGNHCIPGYMERLGIINMHLHVREFYGLRFGGFEGCIRYKAHPYAKMYTQEEAAELLKDFPPVDVFIAHSPPFGINDDATDPAHIGLHALRTYIEEKKPKYFLHGHTYPRADTLITQYSDTKIIYVTGDKITTFETK